MLKQQQKITKYLHRIIDAGINIDDIFYHNISGINILIIDEEQVDDKINDAIDFIIEDSEQYYDIDNSIPYINVTSMPKEEIISANFDTATQGIFKKYNISMTYNEIFQARISENTFGSIVITNAITNTKLFKKQTLKTQSINKEVGVYSNTDVYQLLYEPAESSFNQGKTYAYAA